MRSHLSVRPTWISPGRVVDPAWACTGRVWPAAASPRRWCALTAPFHPCLCAPHVRGRHRRSVSVPLSRGFPRVGVTDRPCPSVSGLSSRDTSRDCVACATNSTAQIKPPHPAGRLAPGSTPLGMARRSGTSGPAAARRARAQSAPGPLTGALLQGGSSWRAR